jgi:hypothetical protein
MGLLIVIRGPRINRFANFYLFFSILLQKIHSLRIRAYFYAKIAGGLLLRLKE